MNNEQSNLLYLVSSQLWYHTGSQPAHILNGSVRSIPVMALGSDGGEVIHSGHVPTTIVLCCPYHINKIVVSESGTFFLHFTGSMMYSLPFLPSRSALFTLDGVGIPMLCDRVYKFN